MKIEKIEHSMKTLPFSETGAKTLYHLLRDAYSGFPELYESEDKRWQEFDHFVYHHLSLMDRNGFVSMVKNTVIGFISWDSRYLPDFVEIGHHCIIKQFLNQGYGRVQFSLGIDRILQFKPRKIIVKTGDHNFFLPARRLYEEAGFHQIQTRQNDSPIIRKVIEYELIVS